MLKYRFWIFYEHLIVPAVAVFDGHDACPSNERNELVAHVQHANIPVSFTNYIRSSIVRFNPSMKCPKVQFQFGVLKGKELMRSKYLIWESRLKQSRQPVPTPQSDSKHADGHSHRSCYQIFRKLHSRGTQLKALLRTELVYLLGQLVPYIFL